MNTYINHTDQPSTLTNTKSLLLCTFLAGQDKGTLHV